MRAREYFENYYRTGEPEFQDIDTGGWPRDRYAAVLRVAASGQRVIDIGCGSGLLLYHLRDRYGELHGLETARNRAERAQAALASAGLNARIVAGDIGDGVDLPDDYFDTVVSTDTMQFVPYLEPVFQEMARLLRPGGSMIIAVPNFLSLKRRLSLLTGAIPGTSAKDQGFAVGPDGIYDHGTLHYFTWSKLERMLRQFGIEPVQRLGYGRFGSIHNVWRRILSNGICVVGEKT